jgi:hypothetical protein
MLKEVIFKALFIGFAALLIVGAINRTSAINEKVSGSDGDPQGVAANTRAAGGVQGNNASGLPWQSYEGVVIEVSEAELVIETTDGTEILVEGRPWLYLAEQGFTVAVGDRFNLTAYYEAGEYKVGDLVNLDTGASIQIRDSDGDPAWRGRGQGQS